VLTNWGGTHQDRRAARRRAVQPGSPRLSRRQEDGGPTGGRKRGRSGRRGLGVGGRGTARVVEDEEGEE